MLSMTGYGRAETQMAQVGHRDQVAQPPLHRDHHPLAQRPFPPGSGHQEKGGRADFPRAHRDQHPGRRGVGSGQRRPVQPQRASAPELPFLAREDQEELNLKEEIDLRTLVRFKEIFVPSETA